MILLNPKMDKYWLAEVSKISIGYWFDIGIVYWVCIGFLSNTSPNTSQYPILDPILIHIFDNILGIGSGIGYKLNTRPNTVLGLVLSLLAILIPNTNWKVNIRHRKTRAGVHGRRRTEDQVFSPRAVRLKDGRGQRTLKFRPSQTEADGGPSFFVQSGPKRTVRPW